MMLGLEKVLVSRRGPGLVMSFAKRRPAVVNFNRGAHVKETWVLPCGEVS
jgi:hypothetical protein